MGTALGATQFAILQEHATNGDRVAYYTQLDDWGYNYGGLALGVVTNDTLSGATANIFFLQNAGKSVTNDELATISLNLMRFDLAARQSFAGSATGQELPVDAVQDYHEAAFALVGVPVTAWTPNFVLDTLTDPAEREAYWDQLLSSSNLGSWGETALQALSPPTFASLAYLGELTATGALAITAQPGDYGTFSISLGNADGGMMIGGNALDNIVTGGNGNDVLIGFDGADQLFGGGGDDILYGGADGFLPNGDTLDGQQGADTYFIETFDVANDTGTDGALDVYNIAGGSFSDADGAYDGAALIQGLSLPSLPSLPFSPFRLAATFDAAPETTSNDPTLGDYISAGVLTFTMDKNGARSLTIVDTGEVLFSEGNANWGDGGFDLDIGREDVSVRGTDTADIMHGTYGADLLLGQAGNDKLFGWSGADEISGGADNDRIYGGRGADALYGDRGDDRVFGGSGHDSVWGNTGDDFVSGGRGNDMVSGGLGDDVLKGNSGHDLLVGGAGADRLIGGSGRDTADYSGSSDAVTIDLGGSGWGWGWWSTGATASGGDAEGDRLYSIENLTGSAEDDNLTGDRGANVLAGGAGNDLLTGGRGQDTFVFNTGDGSDIVTDFDSGTNCWWWHTSGDAVQLGVDGVNTISDVQDLATQLGDDVILNFGGGDVLTLQDTQLNTLNHDDFIFV